MTCPYSTTKNKKKIKCKLYDKHAWVCNKEKLLNGCGMFRELEMVNCQ